MPLMQQAQERAAPPMEDHGEQPTGEGFAKPDISKFIPPDMADAVQRVTAAGMKMMYSPDMRDELTAEIQREGPVPKKLAEGVTGLMLTLDSQANGGIPAKAIFPAAMELLGEAAQVMTAAGQPVTQQDYNDAALMMFSLIGRKLGGTDEQIMGAAQQIVGGAPAAGAEAPPIGPAAGPQGAPA